MIITASAPAKAILLGEHAVNRGASALAVSAGLRASCRLEVLGDGDIVLADGARRAAVSRRAVLALGDEVDRLLAQGDFAGIQALAAADYFAPALYVLASAGERLPALEIRFASEIPRSSGLGSGGAVFVALAAALERAIGAPGHPRDIARRARRGDTIAHGGVASGLDTQTSLYGGAVHYSVADEARPAPMAPGLRLVIGHSGVSAATSAVNARVRAWLAERPARMHVFGEIGMLARYAARALAEGDWPELGRLLNLNQLILERIGVSCPELERLNEAALAAGAYGAKLSGSGGGGIMIALVSDEAAEPVAAAIGAAGGTPIIADIGVAGVAVREE